MPCRKNYGSAQQILCSATQGPLLASRTISVISAKEPFKECFCRKHVYSNFYIPTGNIAPQFQRVTVLILLACIYFSIVCARKRVRPITTNGAGWCSGKALHAYLRCARFEYRPKRKLCLRVLPGDPQTLNSYTDIS
jgi:hypothetical protein